MNKRTVTKVIYVSSKKIVETVIQFLSIAFFINIKFIKNLKKINDRQDELVILGNGPSLANEIESIQKSYLISKDILCVNSFASSEYYEALKPKYYVIIDPSFYSENTNSQRINDVKEKTFNNIYKKTTWPIFLFAPTFYLKSKSITYLKQNNNIITVGFNNIPLAGGFDSIKIKLFDFNLGNPTLRNVLVFSIFFAIKNSYKRILLFGADHSWLHNIKVAKNNYVFLNDTHINNRKNEVIIDNEQGEPIKLYEYLDQLSSTFKEYHLLKKYADLKNIEIINYTSNSFIDAFKKKEIR